MAAWSSCWQELNFYDRREQLQHGSVRHSHRPTVMVRQLQVITPSRDRASSNQINLHHGQIEHLSAVYFLASMSMRERASWTSVPLLHIVQI
jgi:hypothetical protein